MLGLDLACGGGCAGSGDDHALLQTLGGGRRLLRLEPAQPKQLVLHPRHRLDRSGAAIADGGVQLVQSAKAHFVEDVRQHLLPSDGGQRDLYML